MNFKDEIQKLIDAYQQQVDSLEHEQQLPGMGQVCCNTTTISIGKQFIENLQTVLSNCN